MDTILAIVVVLVLAVLVAVMVRFSGKKQQYDERQLILRGRAFQKGFFTILVLGAVYMMIRLFADRSFMEDVVALMLVMIVGIGVFAVDCILHEAFLTANRKPWSYVLICCAAVLSNVSGLYRCIREGTLIRGGLLTIDCIHIALAALFVVVGIVLVCKWSAEKRNAE